MRIVGKPHADSAAFATVHEFLGTSPRPRHPGMNGVEGSEMSGLFDHAGPAIRYVAYHADGTADGALSSAQGFPFKVKPFLSSHLRPMATCLRSLRHGPTGSSRARQSASAAWR
jgi:hypothetical protein